MVAAVLLVTDVLFSFGTAVAVAGAVFVLIAGLWLVLPLWRRRVHLREQAAHRAGRTA
jgi:hypothetical protein